MVYSRQFMTIDNTASGSPDALNLPAMTCVSISLSTNAHRTSHLNSQSIGANKTEDRRHHECRNYHKTDLESEIAIVVLREPGIAPVLHVILRCCHQEPPRLTWFLLQLPVFCMQAVENSLQCRGCWSGEIINIAANLFCTHRTAF